jgi:hypothetical protein
LRSGAILYLTLAVLSIVVARGIRQLKPWAPHLRGLLRGYRGRHAARQNSNLDRRVDRARAKADYVLAKLRNSSRS